jgi:hypothetical protein
MEPTDPPVVLDGDSPWIRETPLECYTEGAMLMWSISDLIGASTLAQLMRQFYIVNALRLVTTGDLERHLVCGSDEPEVRFWFHRFVYGRDGDPPAMPDGYCD